MFSADSTRTTSALEFVDQLTGLGHKPPKPVTTARAALERLRATRAATPKTELVLDDVMQQLVTRAETGDLEPGDMTGVADISDQLALAAARDHLTTAYARAETELGRKASGAVAAWLLSLQAGDLRQRYLDAAAVIDEHAPTIPLSLDDATALRNPKLRETWLAVSDAAETMRQCLGVISQARRVYLLPRSERDPAGAFLGVANPYALDDGRLLTSSGFGTISSTLPERDPHRLLEMSRRGARWHFPTAAEQDAAAARWLDAETDDRRRMSGEAA